MTGAYVVKPIFFIALLFVIKMIAYMYMYIQDG